jgi:hypothetical protein
MSIVRPWRVLTWKHWAWATAIPIAISITLPVQQFHTNWYWAPWRILFHTPWLLFFSYTFLLAIAAAESSVPAGRGPPVGRYVAALIVATVLCVAAIGTFPDLIRAAPQQVIAGQTISPRWKTSPAKVEARRIELMMGFSGVLIYGWIATFIYVRLRKSRHAARALADAEIDRAEAQRILIAAQLVAAHAQVDPAFVLQALENVERAYESDPARGDLLLDEFITFLRDAIPRLRPDPSA